MPRIYFGIDPGIADAGYGIVAVAGGKDSVLDFGSIKTPAGMPQAERLKRLHEQVSGLLVRYKPDAVGIEKIYFSKNVKTALTVTEARGVIRLAVAQAGVPCAEFNPADVKIAVCGNGAAAKLQVQKMVAAILGLKEIPKPDDAADALALALALAHTASYARKV